MGSSDRLEHVRREVGSVAHGLGIQYREIRLLRDSNHTTVHLWPSDVVARVAVTARARGRLSHELDVGRHLAARAAPIVAPTRAVDPGPYEIDGGALTLWTFTPHRTADDRDAPAAIRAYHDVAEALASYGGTLPSFTVELDECRAQLDDLLARRRMSVEDGVRVKDALDVGSIDASDRPLHGDPHLGNVLVTDAGPHWTDFESVCRGPLEWDLSSLPPAAGDALPPHDAARLALLRRARSACVAVWCLAATAPSRAQREAAGFHLDRLRAPST